jgi:peptide/nickel transport system ATP-binding protein
METLLSVKNLSIGIYRRLSSGKEELLSSVEDIGFDIYPGEILGIVGESGSGKSLTALSIPGLLGENKEVIGGSIFFRGAGELLTLSERELEAVRGKEISMVFQEPFSSLNPLVKVGAQIAETLELHAEKDRNLIKGRVRELLEKLRLPDPEKLMETYPHRLSGGMCQRVMIALAVICRPRLLIADEPTTALDQNTQGQIITLLKEINRDLGTSILFISHDLSQIKDLCSRVLVMYSGRILEEGATEEVFFHPAHEYTKGLLGSIPAKANRGKDLASIPGKVPSLEEGRPRGCPFHPRCAKADARCTGEFPPERTVGVNHRTRCVLEIPGS